MSTGYMKNKLHLISVLSALIRKKLFGRSTPLFISWEITNRCNYRCPYCSVWKDRSKEPSLQEILATIDELYKAGTRFISFSGGEPLLRKDLSAIIEHCQLRNMYIKVTTNGSLVEEHIDILKCVDFVLMTFNGPEPVHDAVRHKGSYSDVVRALKVLQKSKIPCGLNCVLTKGAVSHIDELIRFARAHGIPITFQPLEERSRSVDLKKLEPDRAAYGTAIQKLISYKRSGDALILNTLSYLNYIVPWPNTPQRVSCAAGSYFFRINARGDICACDRIKGRRYHLRSGTLRKVLTSSVPVVCTTPCWRNATMELNYLLMARFLSWETFRNILSRVVPISRSLRYRSRAIRKKNMLRSGVCCL